MPTRYTEAIKDGISFQEFALRCVRAMGVCVTMRDDPSDAPIPERFEPSDYHNNALQAAEKALVEFLESTPEAIAEANLAQYNSALAQYSRSIQSKSELLLKYEAMLAQVREWTPPTEEHVEFKKFMVDQLEQSINHDCDHSYCTQPIRITDDEWVASRKKDLQWSVDYHTKQYAEDVKRAADRTQWVQQLWSSLEL